MKTNVRTGLGASQVANPSDDIMLFATMPTTTVHQMVRSKLNVRQRGSDVAELVALIRAHGLLQNLIGYQQVIDGSHSGIVEVVAGGRRLEAIGLLVADGSFPQDFQIPYLLVTEAEAIEISMAENRGRVDMHPADVYAAMMELTNRGRSIDDISIGFNLDVLTVKRCLKLANISPRLIELYRNDEANFDQMMALAISDDHAAQEQAWDSLGKHSRYPHELRRLLTAQKIDIQRDRLVKYVGIASFEKAGGVVTRDLFSDSGAGYISDAGLLENLAMGKLEKHRAKLANEGFPWIDLLPRADYATLAEFAAVRMSLRELTDVQIARITQLDQQISDLEEQHEGCGDSDGGECDTLLGQIDALEKERDAINKSRDNIQNHDDKALAGAVITLDDGGNVVVKRDVIRPADKSRMVKINDDPKPIGGRVRQVHSDRLTHVLTSHRTAALQAEMMDRADVALVVLTHALLTRVMRGYANAGLVAKLSLTEPSLAEEAQASNAGLTFAARRKELIAGLPADAKGEALLAWLLAQSQPAVMRLLAMCVAASLDATQIRDGESVAFKALASALQLDMTKWWTPTAATYFHHVSRERTTEVVSEAVSPQAAVPLEKMKKSAAAESAERSLTGIAWLPSLLRSN